MTLSKSQSGLLSHYSKHPECVDPDTLEEMADRLLQSSPRPRGGRRPAVSYPWLTARTMRERQRREIPMGRAIEYVAAHQDPETGMLSMEGA